MADSDLTLRLTADLSPLARSLREAADRLEPDVAVQRTVDAAFLANLQEGRLTPDLVERCHDIAERLDGGA